MLTTFPPPFFFKVETDGIIVIRRMQSTIQQLPEMVPTILGNLFTTILKNTDNLQLFHGIAQIMEGTLMETIEAMVMATNSRVIVNSNRVAFLKMVTLRRMDILNKMDMAKICMLTHRATVHREENLSTIKAHVMEVIKVNVLTGSHLQLRAIIKLLLACILYLHHL